MGYSGGRTGCGNQTLCRYFFHLEVFSRVFCHLAQIQIHCFGTDGNKTPVLLPSTGGVPIDPAVFGYIRVSQAEGESGLATQRRILNDHGLRDDRIFTDVASGKNMRRPSWTGRSAGCSNRGTRWWSRGLTAWRGTSRRDSKPSRSFTTRASTSAALAEGLDTGDDSPTSRLMLHMLLSLAEWERDTIRDRIRAGVDRAAAEGRTGGRPPALSSEKVEAVRVSWRTAGRSAPRPEPSG